LTEYEAEFLKPCTKGQGYWTATVPTACQPELRLAPPTAAKMMRLPPKADLKVTARVTCRVVPEPEIELPSAEMAHCPFDTELLPGRTMPE
jgi:hypothetical protein